MKTRPILKVSFDDEVLLSAYARERAPTSTVFWKFAAMRYPQEDWVDFGTTILGWWIMAANRMLTRETDVETFMFMDGPCALHVQRLSSGAIQVSFDGFDETLTCDSNEFFDQIVKACYKASSNLRRLGVFQSVADGLAEAASNVEKKLGPITEE